MIRILTILVFLVFAFLSIATFIGLSSGKIFGVAPIVICVTSAAIAIWIFLWDRKQALKARALSTLETQSRMDDLQESAKEENFNLSVNGSSQILVFILLALIGLLVLLYPNEQYLIISLVVGTLLAAVGTFFSFLLLPLIGNPIITIFKNGFKTPLTPMLTWDQLDGVYLMKMWHRGSVTSHNLMFFMPSLPDRISDFGLFNRTLNRFRSGSKRKQFHVTLKNTSEPPEAVFELIRQLWSNSTGKNHEWNPNRSDDYNNALREIQYNRKRLNESLGAHLSPQTRLEILQRHHKEQSQEWDLIRREDKIKIRNVMIGLVLSAAVLAGVVITQFF